MKISHQLTNITAHPFDNPHIKKIILKYINKIIIDMDGIQPSICDPFRNKQKRIQGTKLISNDLNPDFDTTYNLEACDFGELCEREGFGFNLVLFDPPYSLRQLKEQYENIGHKLKKWQTNNMWGRCKDSLARCVYPGGYVISLGWHTHGFGKHRGFEKVEVCVFEQAGSPDRYDLLLTVEKKVQHTLEC